MVYRSGTITAVCAGAFAALFAHSAAAETLPVRGVYAANIDLPAGTQLIEIERFRGDIGSDVELALTDADFFQLGRGQSRTVEVEGNDGTTTSYPIEPDAILRGTVRSEVIERDVQPRIERECVRRDEDDKCVERREVRIECRELTVNVRPRITLASATGAPLYSHNRNRSQSERFCADDGSVPSSFDLLDQMVRSIVEQVRSDLAPVERNRNIRVMERRRDLRREDRDAFRDAVRATETSIEAACSGFEALEATNPEHVSVLFNIGLCFESGGELERAGQYYDRALTIDPGREYPSDGISRIRSRMRAEEQLAARQGY